MKSIVLKAPLFLTLEEITVILYSRPKRYEFCLNAIKDKKSFVLLLFRALRF